MPDPSKDFTPIRDDYEFFATHSTESESDLDAYAERLRSFSPPAGPIRMLDFGCGPGSFTGRFLERAAWGQDRLDLALVEPSAAYCQQAVERLGAMTDRPVRAWGELPVGLVREFDLILANHVLYFVPELETALGRIVRALDPDGLFLTAIADRDNFLIDLWFRCFQLLRQPMPYQTSEDVESALTRLGRSFERRQIRYTLSFPDTVENRLTILRFLLGEHLAAMPRGEVLDLFEPYTAVGRVEIHTGHVQYYLRGGS